MPNPCLSQSPSIALQMVSGSLLAAVNRSAATGNDLVENADGLYVPKPRSCGVQLSTTKSTGGGGGTTLFAFDTVLWDPYGMWSATTGHITINQAGIYLVTASIGLLTVNPAGTMTVYAEVRRNGVGIDSGANPGFHGVADQSAVFQKPEVSVTRTGSRIVVIPQFSFLGVAIGQAAWIGPVQLALNDVLELAVVITGSAFDVVSINGSDASAVKTAMSATYIGSATT